MKTSTKRLIDHKEDLIRGSILRCNGQPPYETIVDFMVIELLQDRKRVYALLVASGYKAGLIYATLPEESIPMKDEGYAIQSDWLRANWGKWGYFDCPLEDVYLVLPSASEQPKE